MLFLNLGDWKLLCLYSHLYINHNEKQIKIFFSRLIYHSLKEQFLQAQFRCMLNAKPPIFSWCPIKKIPKLCLGLKARVAWMGRILGSVLSQFPNSKISLVRMKFFQLRILLTFCYKILMKFDLFKFSCFFNFLRRLGCINSTMNWFV